MSETVIVQTSIFIIYLASIGMHLVKKNLGIAWLYGLQSTALVILILPSFLAHPTLPLLGVTLVFIVIKIILAPKYFVRLVKRHELRFTVSSYANTPMTMLLIMALTSLVSSGVFIPITGLNGGDTTYLALIVSSMLISIFLMVNRKGALSQIIGILSLENSIVAFAVIAGLEQSAVFQLGSLFDIFVWLIVATLFVSMIYRHTGSLDVTTMRRLKD